MKRSLLGTAVFIAAILVSFMFAFSKRISKSGIELAKLIESGEVHVTSDGLVAVVKEMSLPDEVKKLLLPAGADGPYNLFRLHPQIGDVNTLADRAAEQEGWMRYV